MTNSILQYKRAAAPSLLKIIHSTREMFFSICLIKMNNRESDL